jgi:hypothetical protein
MSLKFDKTVSEVTLNAIECYILSWLTNINEREKSFV